MKTQLPSLEATRKPTLNKTMLGLAVGATFASAFFVAGIRYEKAHQPVRLPANQACLSYAKSIEENLKTFPKVDSANIEKLAQECATQADNYQVTLKGSK